MSRAKTDWQLIENEYVLSKVDITYRELAERHGVTEWTMQKHGSIGKWREKRLLHRREVSEKFRKRAQERNIKTMEEMTDEELRIVEQIVGKGLKDILEKDEVVKPGTILEALKYRRKIYEGIYGAQRTPDQVLDVDVEVSLAEIVTALRALYEQEERESGSEGEENS